MAKDSTDALAVGMQRCNWDARDLWIEAFGVGAVLSIAGVESIVAGQQQPTEREYRHLQLALNEHLHDLGLDQPVQDWRKLPDRGH